MLSDMFRGALSNHGCNSEYELWEASGGWDMPYSDNIDDSFKPNPLYYHEDMTNKIDIIEEGEQFTKVRTKTHIDLNLSIPNKIIVKKNNRIYIHSKIYESIRLKKLKWLQDNNKTLTFI